MTRFCQTVTSAAVIVLLFVSATGAAVQRHTPHTDQQIRLQIEDRLRVSHIDAVNVTVHDAVAALSGTVPSAWAKEEAVQQARKTDGVRDVIVSLTIMRAGGDDTIAANILADLRRYDFFTIFDDIDVTVRDGVPTLTGDVTDAYKSEDMATLASKVTGVQQVVNTIRVLPASIADDRIRSAIADGIYRDPPSCNYARRGIPSIHIIVGHGHVTLTGIVNSVVDLRGAEAIARNAFGVLSVENKLRFED